MSRVVFSGLLSLLAGVLIIALASDAEAGSWKKFSDTKGVSLSYKISKELKDQYRTELWLKNRNNYAVEVKFDAIKWSCRAGGVDRSPGQLFTIAARSEKKGQWAGLFYYPCGGKTSDAWKHITVKNMTVKKK